jgi:16S rRNA (guanine527-N7)-methyltransferase
LIWGSGPAPVIAGPLIVFFGFANPEAMETARISVLLHPFLEDGSAAERFSSRADFGAEEPVALSKTQLQDISMHIDMLLRWNARINLTAVRKPEEIVTRHFGESLFAARHLFPPVSGQNANDEGRATYDAIDIGSGAGFPGLPLKIWAPQLRLTLIESNHRKATFLREVVRALTLTDVNVFSARAEQFSGSASLVTLRAVEQFERILPIARRLVAPGGRLALLIGESQAEAALNLLPELRWREPLPIPQSSQRVLTIGMSASEPC